MLVSAGQAGLFVPFMQVTILSPRVRGLGDAHLAVARVVAVQARAGCPSGGGCLQRAGGPHVGPGPPKHFPWFGSWLPSRDPLEGLSVGLCSVAGLVGVCPGQSVLFLGAFSFLSWAPLTIRRGGVAGCSLMLVAIQVGLEACRTYVLALSLGFL